jgi:hypothetical protein
MFRRALATLKNFGPDPVTTLLLFSIAAVPTIALALLVVGSMTKS